MEESFSEQFFKSSAHSAERLVDLVLQHAPSPKRVLDVGCGSGEFLCALLGRLPHSTGLGIDVSPLNIQAAQDLSTKKELQNRCSFEHQDVNALSLGDFDLIVADSVVHYLKGTAFEVLTLLKSKLASGGMIVVRLPEHSFRNRCIWLTRRLLQLLRSTALSEVLFWASKCFFPTASEELLKSRVHYCYLLPLHAWSPQLRKGMWQSGLCALNIIREPANFLCPRHITVVMQPEPETSRAATNCD